MNETRRMQAFNRQLDRLLSGQAVDGRASGLAAQDRDALQLAERLAGLDFGAELRPRGDLIIAARSRRARSVRGVQPALRWSLGAALLVLLALLVVFREPVAASLGRWFGYVYLPQVGFVSVDRVRVLRNPVTQQVDGRSLTVERGFSSDGESQLWLSYSDTARPADGAWLETEDGQRIALGTWSWDPDEVGAHGVRLYFPPIPADARVTILALPEGWRIPLEWIPASQSALTPADLAEPLPLATLVPGDEEAGPATQSAATLPCTGAAGVQLCVQAAARSQDGLQVMVNAQSSGALLPGIDSDMTLVALSTGAGSLQLVDEAGNEHPPAESMQGSSRESDVKMSESLLFPGAQGLHGRLTLVMPAVYVHVPLDAELAVDVGTDPQAGQVFALDHTVTVAGIPVHFNQAVIEQDPVGDLHLKVTSQVVESRDGLTPYLITLGRPLRVDSGYGYGSESGVLSLSVNLKQLGETLNGVIQFPLVGASLRLEGPFRLSFTAPAEQGLPTETPKVIQGGEFLPMPSGEPLPMDAYQYSGRALHPGDLLAVTIASDHSMLYASSGGQPAEALATLPGQVLALYVHADGGGIDYVTGQADSDQGVRYEQLYSLRFGDAAPHLLVGAFERYAYGFSWSFDGRWLGYVAPPEGPGEGSARWLHLIDLTCRTGGDCIRQVEASDAHLDLYDLAWSPVDEQLAIIGASQESPYGMSDVFLVSINAQSGQARLTNLTQSPQINDESVQWQADGRALAITCSTDDLPINYYGLCRNELQVGQDELVNRDLPYNMRLALLTPDGQTLVDRTFVFENGFQHVRAFSLASGETRVLAEWPAAKGDVLDTVLSPDGGHLVVAEPGSHALRLIGLVDGAWQAVLQSDLPLSWVGWLH